MTAILIDLCQICIIQIQIKYNIEAGRDQDHLSEGKKQCVTYFQNYVKSLHRKYRYLELYNFSGLKLS